MDKQVIYLQLLQALYALRDNDRESFEDGIVAYI